MTDRFSGGLRSVLFFTALALAFMVVGSPTALAGHGDATPTDELAAGCATLPGQLHVGQQTIFAAGHVGGEGEVTYRWSGAVTAEGQFVRPTFDTPGVKALYLIAQDEDGNTASMRCAILVESATAQTGVGGAPGTVGQAPTGDTNGTTGQAGDDVTTPPVDNGAGDDDVDVDIDGEDVDVDGVFGGDTDGASAGRIILWIVIVLIVISLIVLFWRRYSDEHGEAGESAGPKEPEEPAEDTTPNTDTQEDATETTDEDETPPFTEQDIAEAEQVDEGDEDIIIPPAR